MKAEWMGRYRRLISSIVLQGNEYARQQNIKHEIVDGLFLSAQEWQILEYTIECGSDSSNMISIAERLGVPQSTFSKTVKMLCSMGLVDKYQSTHNRKNIILKPTEYAQRIYEINAKRLNQELFGGFFKILEDVDDENLEKFTRAMEQLYLDMVTDGKQTEEPERLIKKT